MEYMENGTGQNPVCDQSYLRPATDTNKPHDMGKMIIKNAVYVTGPAIQNTQLLCNIVPIQGRYTWRHDKVLETFPHWIKLKRSLANKASKVKESQIQFVKAEQKPQNKRY